MSIAVFRRWFNLINPLFTHAKEGRLVSLFRRREASYSIAKQAVRMIGTMYPPPPREAPKWTLSYPRYLLLLAWVAALVSPLLIAPAVAQTDYDIDDNRLIEIRNLTQLNAMRYDLNGDGTVAGANTANYNAAFPNAATGMGCPSSCNGYELMTDLTFPTDSSDPLYTWTPVGIPGTPFTGTFDGNGHTLTGLRVNVSNSDDAGLFGTLGNNGIIRNVGIIDAKVTLTGHSRSVGALVGLIQSGGQVYSSYVQGGSVAPSGASVRGGGLAGRNQGNSGLLLHGRCQL